MKAILIITCVLFAGLAQAEKYVRKAPMSPGLVEGVGTSRASALRAAIRNIPSGYERDLKRDLVFKCVRKEDARCYTYRYTIHVAKRQGGL